MNTAEYFDNLEAAQERAKELVMKYGTMVSIYEGTLHSETSVIVARRPPRPQTKENKMIKIVTGSDPKKVEVELNEFYKEGWSLHTFNSCSTGHGIQLIAVLEKYTDEDEEC